MTKLENEFTKAFEKFFTAAPVNYDETIKNVAEYNAKFYEIALGAAKKNAAINQAWTKETLGKLDALTKVQDDVADYSKVATDIVSAQVQAAPEHISAFAEVAKSAQSDTIELMLSMGKEVQAEVAKTTGKKAA